MKRGLLFLLPAVAITLFPAACGDSPTAGVDPAELQISLEVVGGDLQTGPAGQELSNPLVVRVVNHKGSGVKDQLVNFRVAQGGGSTWAGSAITDRNGQAQDYWTLGMSGPQVVEVRAVDPSNGEKIVYATFAATVEGPPPEVDADGDGFKPSDGDCDDSDPTVYPGAEELPDGKDNNCNGSVDESPTDLSGVLLSEIDYDMVGEDVSEFVEIYNGSDAPVDLSTLALVLYNGATEQSYAAFSLTGTLAPGAYHAVPFGTNGIQNGPTDAVALYRGTPSEFTVPQVDERLLDALVYEDDGSAESVTALMEWSGDSPADLPDANGSLQRCGPLSRSGDAWLFVDPPTPGAATDCAGASNDWDADGLSNTDEEAVYGSDPLDPDTDGDGVADGLEVQLWEYLNQTGYPLDLWAVWLDADWDDDGLSDYDEAYDADGNPLIPAPGQIPFGANYDRDGDGLGDGLESGVAAPIPGGFSGGTGVPFVGSDPAVFIPDADPNTTTDPDHGDSDNDGLSDGVEDLNQDGAWDGTVDAPGGFETNPALWDSDGDGASDGEEGGPGANAPDADQDGVIAALDTDEVLAQNQPPVIESMDLTPVTIWGGQAVQLQCSALAVDPDQGPVDLSYSFTFTQNGRPLEEISGSEGSAGHYLDNPVGGDEIACVVVASDGGDDSEPMGIAVIVQEHNQRPVAGTVQINPEPAYTDSELVCVAEGFFDPDASPNPLVHDFGWGVYRDGPNLVYEQFESLAENQSILGFTELAPGDEVTCSVYGNDGLETSEPAGANVTVLEGALPALALSEVDYDNDGADHSEFIEIVNLDTGPVSIGGLELYAIWADGSATLEATLPNLTLSPGEFHVEWFNERLGNGPNGVVLSDASGNAFDMLLYEDDGSSFDLWVSMGIVPTSAGDPGTGSLQRCGPLFMNGDDWAFSSVITPGSANDCSDSGPTDTDDDGIPDDVELAAGLDPYNPDTDSDGIPDGVEGLEDFDGDGLPNAIDTDSDGDGILDWDEQQPQYEWDVDGDGAPNYLDLDADGDGVPDATEGMTDSDSDGIPDFLDPATSPAPELVLLSEVDYDNEGIDYTEFVEIHNAGTDWVDLTGYQIGRVNPDGAQAFLRVVSVGAVPPGGFHVEAFNQELQNGPDGIVLLDPSGSTVDMLLYEDDGSVFAAWVVLGIIPTPLIDPGLGSLQRCGLQPMDGSNWIYSPTLTPDAPNACGTP